MSSCIPKFPQNHSPLSKAQKTRKVLDIIVSVDIITQQLSNSATQQLSNSATQQLSNSATQQLSNSATQQLSNSATQQLSNSATQGVKSVCALKNGQPLHSANNIIIFSHQLLQTAQAVLVFLLLHTGGTLLPLAYFVR